MAQNSDYLTKYKELEIIGRGNFGSATLVQSLQDNVIYVAKKVVLGGLNQKEQDGAHLEVNLLKELKHPHIVEYKESFIENGILIIIMEYCEEGDLAYFIKKKAQKQEYMDEKLILNWFLQLLLALEFVHRKKILHRDIKSSNIFLRSNGTVKLGDFGISRVLENTHEAAMTVVGTPYYMSPEVCENKPYTFKSDVWALGCVLYEMCTLKHAFSASNLLGLVYKIVREKHEPIPGIYSSELSTLVQKLLIKNVQTRPSIRDIFMELLIQRTIEEFIRTDGQYTTMVKIPVKKTQVHKELKKQHTQNLNSTPRSITDTTQMSNVQSPCGNTTMMSNVPTNGFLSTTKNTPPNKQQQIIETETPQQRLARRKEEKAREEEEKMKNAARESLMARNQDKQRKNKELQGNISITGQQTHGKSSSKLQNEIMQNRNSYESPTQLYNPNPIGGGGHGPNYMNDPNNYQQYSQYKPTQSNYEYSSPTFPKQNDFGGKYNNGGQNMNDNTFNTLSRVSQASAFNLNDGSKDFNEMQQGFMNQTNQSLSYSQSNGSLPNKSNMYNNQQNQYGNPYNNQGAYGYGGGYGVKDNTGYSVYSIRTEYDPPINTNVPKNNNYYQDERPLPTLAKNTNNLKGTTRYQKEDNYEDDEYAEDFEEYWSDEEEGGNERLTSKPTQKEFSDVMNLYKEKLNFGNQKNNTETEETRESTYESEKSQPEQLSKSQKLGNTATTTRASQIAVIINRAKQTLGAQLYDQAYKYLKKQRDLGTPDKKIQEELANMVGKKNLAVCFEIDQVIFLESM